MKILLVASQPYCTSGYSKIAYLLSNTLATVKLKNDEKIEVTYFAVDGYSETLKNERRLADNIKVVPDMNSVHSGELYKKINPLIIKEKPDILFIYNDIIVACNIFNKLLELKPKQKKFKIITYIDLVYPFEKFLFINHMNKFSDKILVFSDYWKENLTKMRVNADKIAILEHPFFNKLVSVDQSMAKGKLGLLESDFVVLNLNRNNYRKCWDITLKAFLLFLKKNHFNKRIKLFCKPSIVEPGGYHIIESLKTYTVMYDVYESYEDILKNHIIFPFQNAETRSLSDDLVNIIYNACDVGINTCCGEGFGLCNMEHAYLGKPQVVSNVGGLSDIFSSDNSIKIDSCYQLTCCDTIDQHTGELHYGDPKDFASGLQIYFDNPELMKEHGAKISTHIKNKYTMKNFRDIVSREINSIME